MIKGEIPREKIWPITLSSGRIQEGMIFSTAFLLNGQIFRGIADGSVTGSKGIQKGPLEDKEQNH